MRLLTRGFCIQGAGGATAIARVVRETTGLPTEKLTTSAGTFFRCNLTQEQADAWVDPECIKLFDAKRANRFVGAKIAVTQPLDAIDRAIAAANASDDYNSPAHNVPAIIEVAVTKKSSKRSKNIAA